MPLPKRAAIAIQRFRGAVGTARGVWLAGTIPAAYGSFNRMNQFKMQGNKVRPAIKHARSPCQALGYTAVLPLARR